MIQDTSVYREDLVVAEIIYNPKETRMMREAKEVRCEMRGRWKRHAPVAGGRGISFIYRPGNAVEKMKAKFFTE